MDHQKILNYEHFLNEKLREDLRVVLEQREKIYSQIAEYLQLKSVIERMKETDYTKESLKTKVDLGCNFYVHANITDATFLYVSVGFGFFVQLTHEEALKFISRKSDQLTQKADGLTKDAAKIKAHIKLVLEGLREIQHMQMEQKTPHRDVL